MEDGLFHLSNSAGKGLVKAWIIILILSMGNNSDITQREKTIT